MCGRVQVTTPAKSIAEFFQAMCFMDVAPRYNISPTGNLPMVRVEPQQGGRVLEPAYWGLIPSWSKDPKIANRLTNARAETLSEKPSFRGAYKYRRCLLIIDGFYEWKRAGSVKQPYYFHREDGRPMAFAGLWEHWSGPNGEEIQSTTIITTEANGMMAPIHHRMPVILPPEDFDLWLDPSLQQGKAVTHLLRPWAGGGMVCYAVSTFVNNSRNEGAACIRPHETVQPKEDDDPQLSLF